jgi:hypothetical protein
METKVLVKFVHIDGEDSPIAIQEVTLREAVDLLTLVRTAEYCSLAWEEPSEQLYRYIGETLFLADNKGGTVNMLTILLGDKG